jgi:FkbM family methyltransferase
VLIEVLANINDRLFSRLGLYVTNRSRNFRCAVRGCLTFESINLVMDVGASHGQYGKWLRLNKYNGRIVSFEPEEISYRKLQKRSLDDGMWEVHNVAVGDARGSGVLQVAGNLVSSSLLKMTTLHQTAAEGSASTGVQKVEIEPLDTFIPTVSDDPEVRIHLKIDVQGFENDVFLGATKLLEDQRLRSIEIELSTATLYFRQSNWIEVMKLLESAGFSLISISGGFFEAQSRRMLQFDALLVRTR